MKLTCPKCGHSPAISLWKRCLLPITGEKHCCQCGTPLDNSTFCKNLQDGAAILSIFLGWFLAPSRLAFLAFPFLTLFLGGFVSAFLSPLVSTLPEDQESIPAPKVAGMKVQLTCPKCGKAPVMTPMRKANLFYRSVPRCPWCGTPLSNPSWFDLGRLAVLFGVLLLSARFIHSGSLLFLIFVGMDVLTGLISLYCIPLQKHWNINDDN